MASESYVCLLRGINVGGKSLKMEPVRGLFDALGFSGVRTYVQSGNVVFGAKAAPAVKKIEDAIREEFGMEVSVVLRSARQMAAVLRANPFLKRKGIDLKRLYVTFLSEKAPSAGLKLLGEIKAGKDEFEALGTELYLHCPVGYGESRLNNNAVERALKLTATTRNWNTVGKLVEMLAP